MVVGLPAPCRGRNSDLKADGIRAADETDENNEGAAFAPNHP